jgi:hypothetical protein
MQIHRESSSKKHHPVTGKVLACLFAPLVLCSCFGFLEPPPAVSPVAANGTVKVGDYTFTIPGGPRKHVDGRSAQRVNDGNFCLNDTYCFWTKKAVLADSADEFERAIKHDQCTYGAKTIRQKESATGEHEIVFTCPLAKENPMRYAKVKSVAGARVIFVATVTNEESLPALQSIADSIRK